MILVYDIFGNLIGEYNADGTLRSEWVYLGNHRLAMIVPEEGGGGGLPGCSGLPPPPDICGLGGLDDGIALNWAIIGIAPFLVWAGFNFRKRRTASALIFISGLGIIIFVMSREGKSQEAPTEAVYYYHNDHLGTPKVITDQNGVIQWEAVMEPFGEIDTFIASNANNPFRFPGQYEDDLTGLYYNHHRYYMPGLGRYNRVDPLQKRIDLEYYRYATNNPIIYMDWTGLARYFGSCTYISGGKILGAGVMYCDVFGICGHDNIRQRGKLIVMLSGATVGFVPLGITAFPLLQEDDLYGRGDILNMGGKACIISISGALGIGSYIGALFLGETWSVGDYGAADAGYQAGFDATADMFMGISIPYDIKEECCE